MFSWQKTPRAVDADRLPPGQVLTEKFPVLHFGVVPEYPDLATWDLRVWGEVESAFSLTWAELLALPRREVSLDIHCVTRWSKFDTTWEGAALTALAEAAQVKTSAHHVIFHSEHGYTANVPLDIALQPDCLVAWLYDGRPLEPDHGYPLRAIVPGRYFWKSAKWLRGIEFSAADHPGFWERNGYHNNADPWPEERYSE